MAALDIGRVCIKTAGREAGKYCVVIKKVDDNFVFVTGPKVLTGVKRRRCNVEHLEPTEHLLKIKTDATESEVLDGYKTENLLRKFGLEKPSPEVVKEAEKKVPRVEEKKPEKKEEKPKEEKLEKPKPEKEKPVKVKEKETKKTPTKGKTKKK